MFGLSDLWAAFKRLTASVNRTADLFDKANDDLEERLKVRGVDPVKPVLPPPEDDDDDDLDHRAGTDNGSGKKKHRNRV